MPNPALLKALGYGTFVFALKHSVGVHIILYRIKGHHLIVRQAAAKEFQPLRQFQELPNVAYTRSLAGWYQGGAFLVLTALLNLNWAKNPDSLKEPLNAAMAALVSLISWGSSAWYLRKGLKASGVLTAAAGLLQAWAAFQ
ncbi:hypothetical protein N7468_005537 [Penicillium chermesinum]|uniref:Uncharacterized protein n=1 Tax=Penicillium chermesinum TaxID=63820 RepID=A0A9W9TN29_9EURO|nr:uncharacterized protein N7468_005537 [Penicillium chermesinum]KAJ5232581.1 hypothetical protein N7468_005537 [Penicillium chermesinum]